MGSQTKWLFMNEDPKFSGFMNQPLAYGSRLCLLVYKSINYGYA